MTGLMPAASRISQIQQLLDRLAARDPFGPALPSLPVSPFASLLTSTSGPAPSRLRESLPPPGPAVAPPAARPLLQAAAPLFRPGSVEATPPVEAGGPAASNSLEEALARFDKLAGQIPYAALIRENAVRSHVDPLLIASVIRTESNFHAHSVSSAGAGGLMQLMPALARSFRVDDVFDPAQNIAAGTRYLASLLHDLGRADLAIAGYHAGGGNVARNPSLTGLPVTARYVSKVLGTWGTYLAEATP